VYALYLLSVWLHLLAVVTWLGGLLFLALVVVPITRRAAYSAVAPGLIQESGTRFRAIGWLCLGLLVLTGIVNLAYRGYGWADLLTGALFRPPFGHVLGAKLLLVAMILAISAAHDFWLGPRATHAWQAAPASPEARRLRRQATWLARLNALLALATVALGVLLVRGLP
jgi:uncharacterized membrane protein